MFNAIYFTYDGVYSGEYGLYIASTNGEFIQTTSVFSPTLSIGKGVKSKRFFYSGIDYEDSPQYQFSILSEDAIPEDERRKILAWLLGRNEFKKLYIDQEEYQDVYFNCIFTAVDLIYVGGYCHGFTLTAKFDSPYCYGTPETLTVNLIKDTPTNIEIYLDCDVVDDYVYPTLSFTKDITIKNKTDGSRITGYENVAANESKIVIDNELKIIEGFDLNGASFSGHRLSNFNLNWLRLKKGKNELELTGEGEVTITCPRYILLGF